MSNGPNPFETTEEQIANQMTHGELVSELAETLEVDRDTIAPKLEDLSTADLIGFLTKIQGEGGVVGGDFENDVAANVDDGLEDIPSGVYE